MSQHTPSSQELPSPKWYDWLLLVTRKRHLIRVTGDSMQPTLHAADLVIVNKNAYINQIPSVGEIVIAKHPYQKDITIIKRVAEVTSENRIVLHSDNPKAGSDSRQFGTVSPTRLLGQVTSRLPRSK